MQHSEQQLKFCSLRYLQAQPFCWTLKHHQRGQVPLRATDKNHLVLQLMANKPHPCAYQGLLRCVPLLCPAVPLCPLGDGCQPPSSCLLEGAGPTAPLLQEPPWHWKEAEVSHCPTTSPQPPAQQCSAHLGHAVLTACDGYSSVLTAASPCFCLSLCSLH